MKKRLPGVRIALGSNDAGRQKVMLSLTVEQCALLEALASEHGLDKSGVVKMLLHQERRRLTNEARCTIAQTSSEPVRIGVTVYTMPHAPGQFLQVL